MEPRINTMSRTVCETIEISRCPQLKENEYNERQKAHWTAITESQQIIEADDRGQE